MTKVCNFCEKDKTGFKMQIIQVAGVGIEKLKCKPRQYKKHNCRVLGNINNKDLNKSKISTSAKRLFYPCEKKN